MSLFFCFVFLFRHVINLLTILAGPASRQPYNGPTLAEGWACMAEGGWLLVETTCKQLGDVVPLCVMP